MHEHDGDISLLQRMDAESARREYPPAYPKMPDVPAGRYTDEHFHALEMAHMWRKSWLYAGQESEFPDVGAYRLFEKLGVSVIVIRQKDGEIRAFHNICRHRAAPVLAQKCGKAKRLVCPYHAWSYDLDGQLKSVPEDYNFSDLDYAELGLRPVRCASWRGLVYINLDADAPSLTDRLGMMPQQVENIFPLEELSVKKFASIEIACNWKAAYDNFLESYHVRTIHAKTILPWLDTSTFTISLFDKGHSRYTVRRKITDRLGSGDGGMPVVPGADKLFDQNTMGMCFFPNMIGALDPAGFPWVTFWPDGPGKTIMDVQLVGWKGDDSAHWDKVMGHVLRIFEEDVALLEGVQKSLESGYCDRMKLGYTERIIYGYQIEIDRLIGAHNIPAHLRLDPVLEVGVDV